MIYFRAAVIIIVALAGLIYLAGSFIAASFDILQWDGVGRFAAVMVWLACGILVAGGARQCSNTEREGQG